MADFYIKQGDTLPTLDVTLVQANRKPLSLVGATGVTFRMRNSAGEAVIESPATIVDASKGKVCYRWGSTDTAEAGRYEAEFQVDFDGETQTIPNTDYIDISIVAVLPPVEEE